MRRKRTALVVYDRERHVSCIGPSEAALLHTYSMSALLSEWGSAHVESRTEELASADSVVWSSGVFVELGWLGQGSTIGGGIDLIEMYIVVVGGQTTLKLQDNSCCSNYSAAYQYLL